MEPKSITGKDMSKVTQIYRVTQYNIACCYSGLNQVNISCASSDSNRQETSVDHALRIYFRDQSCRKKGGIKRTCHSSYYLKIPAASCLSPS